MEILEAFDLTGSCAAWRTWRLRLRMEPGARLGVSLPPAVKAGGPEASRGSGRARTTR
jgi:hypothetical protein